MRITAKHYETLTKKLPSFCFIRESVLTLTDLERTLSEPVDELLYDDGNYEILAGGELVRTGDLDGKEPTIERVETRLEGSFNLTEGEMRVIMQQLLKVAAKDPLRPVTECAWVDGEYLVASDGHTLRKVRKSEPVEGAYLLPLRPLSNLIPLEGCAVSVHDKVVELCFPDGFTASVASVDSLVPNWRSVVPPLYDLPAILRLSVKELKNSILPYLKKAPAPTVVVTAKGLVVDWVGNLRQLVFPYESLSEAPERELDGLIMPMVNIGGVGTSLGEKAYADRLEAVGGWFTGFNLEKLIALAGSAKTVTLAYEEANRAILVWLD